MFSSVKLVNLERDWRVLSLTEGQHERFNKVKFVKELRKVKLTCFSGKTKQRDCNRKVKRLVNCARYSPPICPQFSTTKCCNLSWVSKAIPSLVIWSLSSITKDTREVSCLTVFIDLSVTLGGRKNFVKCVSLLRASTPWSFIRIHSQKWSKTTKTKMSNIQEWNVLFFWIRRDIYHEDQVLSMTQVVTLNETKSNLKDYNNLVRWVWSNEWNSSI